MLGVEGMFRGLKMVAGWFFRGLTRVSHRTVGFYKVFVALIGFLCF